MSYKITELPKQLWLKFGERAARRIEQRDTQGDLVRIDNTNVAQSLAGAFIAILERPSLKAAEDYADLQLKKSKQLEAASIERLREAEEQLETLTPENRVPH